MSDSDPARPALRQLLWIAAGVAVLTLLVVAVSWLFSPRRLPGEAAGEGSTSPLVEERVQKETFAPESLSAGSSQVTEGGVVKPPERTSEPGYDAPDPAPAGSALPDAPPSPPGALLETDPKAPTPSATPSSSPGPPALSKGFAVQVGAFSEEAKARDVASRLKRLGYSASVLAKDGRYKVLAKGFSDRADAEKAQVALANAGIKDPFIVPVE